MNKDIIYIDVEDDITAVIGKVKDAKEKIVALVPPKRIGILQSAVNLRLLGRAAEQSGKRLVLISSNQALTALAAAAQLPVARNLQSKPEIPEIPALSIDDGEDVIDGAQLPVGELARTGDTGPNGMGSVGFSDPAIDAAVAANAAEESTRAKPPVAGTALARPRVKSGVKVPNFSQFRKKMLLIIGGGIVLIAFLIWAIFIAPHATVIITARTTDSSMNGNVILDPTNPTSLSGTTLHATTQQLKKTASLNFTATGTKDVGDTATGTVSFSTNSINALGTTIPAGTQLTSSGGMVYTTDSSVTMTYENHNGATSGVTATGRGTKYNGASGSMSGAPSGVSASLTGATAGGTDKTVTVVTKDDVQKVTDQLNAQDTSAIKKQLVGQFSGDSVAIDQSFKADTSGVTAVPAIDQEATDGKAVLSGTITYSMTGVGKNEIDHYLADYYAQQLKSTDNQRVYDNGAKGVSFTNVAASGSNYTATMVATAKIGPKINDTAIKNAAKGRRYGEIQSSIESIQGVDNVDIKFWPFWVSTAPNDINKIAVKFNLNESK